MNASIQKVEAIFSAASALGTAGQRDEYLARACSGDASLLKEVEALLRASDHAGGFLSAPTSGELETGQFARAAANLAMAGETLETLETRAPEQPGDRIGRYRLLQKIGEGGCGVVYMAQQEEPVQRRVAFKLIKPGMDTKQIVARFEAERQALALMDHPNIAKVLDGGETANGRPFFVMELVRGLKITEYCDQASLPTAARLDLFVQVCQAVQHAHQKGIIHRDLKPSNILVTLNDGVAVPKVIDFGIAKATAGQPLTDKTVFTAFEQFIGTPAYMSPEQALMTSLDIDTRSDIYSLGVLLYELLTGRTPFDASEMLAAGIDEMRRTIREKDPARPSARLSTLPQLDLTTAARRRATDAPRLIDSLQGDLDWIVMKCLEKDRSRRYETANGLAADLQRHLRSEPVLARPPSATYRFQKMARRNRAAFAAGGAVLAALAVGLGLFVWQFIEKGKALRSAEMEAKKSLTVAGFHKTMIESMQPSIAMGRDTTLLREFADRTFAQLKSGLKDEPVVEVEMRSALGRVYLALGENERAEALYRETLPRMRALWPKDHPDLADLLSNFAEALNNQGKGKEAEPLAHEALAIHQRIYGENHPAVARSVLLVGKCIAQIKVFQRKLYPQGDLKAAEEWVRDALARFEKLHGPEHRDIAIALRHLAILEGLQGRGEEDEKTIRRALAMAKKLLGETDPLVIRLTIDLCGAVRNSAEGVVLLRDLLATQRRVLGNDNRMVADTLATLTGTLFDQGRAEEAEPLARESFELARKLYGADSPKAAGTANDLSVILMDLKRHAEAEPLLRDAAEVVKKMAPRDPAFLILALQNYAITLRSLEKYAEAEAVYREQLAFAREIPDLPPVKLDEALGNIADLMLRQNKVAEYDRLLESWAAQSIGPKQIAGLQTLSGDFHARRGRWSEASVRFRKAIDLDPEQHENHHKLAAILVQTGEIEAYRKLCQTETARFGGSKNPNEAERMAKDCLFRPDSNADLKIVRAWADLAVTDGSRSSDLPWFQHAKAMAEYRSGNFAAAIEWEKKVVGGDGDREVQARAVLAMAHHQAGDAPAARANLASALEAHAKLPAPNSEDLGSTWLDWIIANTLLAEARGLIESHRSGENAAQNPAEAANVNNPGE